MKTFYVITDTKNSNDHTMYLFEGQTNTSLTPHLEVAKTFTTEEDAENYIEWYEIEDWAGIEEEEYFFKLEDTFLTKLPSGHGHWKIKAESNGFSHTITTDNSQLIDDAFGSDDRETSWYESKEDARETIIEMINEA